MSVDVTEACCLGGSSRLGRLEQAAEPRVSIRAERTKIDFFTMCLLLLRCCAVAVSISIVDEPTHSSLRPTFKDSQQKRRTDANSARIRKQFLKDSHKMRDQRSDHHFIDVLSATRARAFNRASCLPVFARRFFANRFLARCTFHRAAIVEVRTHPLTAAKCGAVVTVDRASAAACTRHEVRAECVGFCARNRGQSWHNEKCS